MQLTNYLAGTLDPSPAPSPEHWISQTLGSSTIHHQKATALSFPVMCGTCARERKKTVRTWLTFCALPYSDSLWLTLYVAKIKSARAAGSKLFFRDPKKWVQSAGTDTV